MHWSRSVADAAAWLGHQRVDAVVSDVRLPDGSGESLFEQAQALPAGPPPWLFITAYATVDRAVAMLRVGARDYVTKPFDIHRVSRKSAFHGGAAARARAGARRRRVGPSAPMRLLAGQACRVAERARTVLITGESGSGKEVLARHLHALAHPGSDAPFVAVNCGAIPDGLVEAALFGHERGTFTGADRQRRGYFEQAHGGTLFLDEVAELPAAMQVRLLRVLQDRRVQRLGAESFIEIDLRVICATHRDLRQRVEHSLFREDLYYRIHVVHLRVPPLRDRPDDVLWLAQVFLTEQSTLQAEPERRLSAAARAAVLGHAWPGNVRELHNRIERACVMGPGAEISVADLFDEREPAAAAAVLPTLESFVADAEKEYLTAILSRFEGKVGQTAEALGISRKTLREKSRRHGLRTKD